MEKEILSAILLDDLDTARALVKNAPEGFAPLADLLEQTQGKPSPLSNLRSRSPKFVTIGASYTCDLRCEMCYSGFSDRSNLYEDYKYFLPEQFAALREWVKGASGVSFVGLGETLYSPYLPEFIKKTGGKVSSVTTSGLPLTQEKAEEFVRSGLGFLNLSFDGDATAGHGGGRELYAQKFWSKVAMLRDVKKAMHSELPSLVLTISVNQENMGQIDDIISQAHQYEVADIILSPMTPLNDALYDKSIFVDYETYKKTLNKILSRWSGNGMRVRINGLHKTLTDSIKTCYYVDNYLNFHGKSERPTICCGPIRIPLENSGVPATRYWNSFPFRYLRYMHFCSEPDQLPVACRNCWVMNLKQYAGECRSFYNHREENAAALPIYQEASRLKREGNISKAEEFFHTVLQTQCDIELKGKASFHLGEIRVMRKHYPEALVLMKQAVRHYFDHKAAFAYLYLLLMLLDEPKDIKKRKPKFYIGYWG